MQLTTTSVGTGSAMGSTEGARGATGVEPMAGGRTKLNSSPPDPEVPEKKRRRKFTAKYKLRVLDDADACTGPGQIGALLRREGLYSSHLTHLEAPKAKGAFNRNGAPKARSQKGR